MIAKPPSVVGADHEIHSVPSACLPTVNEFGAPGTLAGILTAWLVLPAISTELSAVRVMILTL